MADWSDPETDVLADFKAFIEQSLQSPPQPLVPWQERWIESALRGEHLMVYGGRNTGRTQAQRVWNEMRAKDPLLSGLVYTVVDEITDWDQPVRDEAWAREFLGQWSEPVVGVDPSRGRDSAVTWGWTHPRDLADAPRPSPEFDALDLCVLGVSPDDHLAPPRVSNPGRPRY